MGQTTTSDILRIFASGPDRDILRKSYRGVGLITLRMSGGGNVD
jgi:hypothetical protein